MMKLDVKPGLDQAPARCQARNSTRDSRRRSSFSGKREPVSQENAARRRSTRRVSLTSLRMSWSDGGAEAEAEAAARKARRHAVSRTAQMRLLRSQAQWATAWFVNFSIFFLMCWFSLTYAMLLGAKATDEWLMALLQGFWFGTAVLEPIEVAALVMLPFLFDNSCVAECRTKAKDLGFV